MVYFTIYFRQVNPKRFDFPTQRVFKNEIPLAIQQITYNMKRCITNIISIIVLLPMSLPINMLRCTYLPCEIICSK